MAGVPVYSSNLPQMKKIIDKYNVGKYVDLENSENVIDDLYTMINDENLLKEYSKKCFEASKELNWENEFEKFTNEFLKN
jgi:glycosyltransferase involved in cell wall biosynthesis